MATNFQELAAAEATNLERTVKYLGATGELMGDVEALYTTLSPLIGFPGGDIETSDELLAVVSILNLSVMCRMFLAKAVLECLRMYQADSLANVRRAIESCAFAVRMSKHHELSRIWAEAGKAEDKKYEAYRKAFGAADVYPKKATHPDYDPLLTEIKGRFDACSKLSHASIFGMANHFGTVPKDKNTARKRLVNVFDMPKDSFVSSFFFILHAHMMMLRLFGRVLEPYTTNLSVWTKEFSYVEGKVQRHTRKWLPTISALYDARNRKS